MATQTLPLTTSQARRDLPVATAIPNGRPDGRPDGQPDQQSERRAHTRNKNFDLLRIFFAVLVMLAHAAEFTDGNRSREPFTRLFHLDMTAGSMAVDGFFLLSGFLIVQSWISGPRLGPYLLKRCLRILPGYFVAAAFAIVAGGLLAPAVPHFFADYWSRHGYYLRSLLFLGNPLAPALYPTLVWHQVDGSMWTIAYEFRCYLVVALLGMLGMVRRPRVWAAVTGAFLLIALTPPLQHLLYWARFSRYWGEPAQDWRLYSMFFLGACFFLFRDRIVFRPRYAALAVLLQALTLLHKPWFEPALGLFGGYLLFYAGRLPLRLPERLQRVPDISYGLYLYGAPVECLWISHFHGSPWVTFAICTVIAAIFGWFSWEFVERPMLRFKPRRPALSPNLRPDLAGAAQRFSGSAAPAALAHPAP